HNRNPITVPRNVTLGAEGDLAVTGEGEERVYLVGGQIISFDLVAALRMEVEDVGIRAAPDGIGSREDPKILELVANDIALQVTDVQNPASFFQQNTRRVGIEGTDFRISVCDIAHSLAGGIRKAANGRAEGGIHILPASRRRPEPGVVGGRY